MKKYLAPVLFLFSSLCQAGVVEENANAKSECDLISNIAKQYAKFKYDNRGYSVDSVNYKDPVVHAFMPLLDILTNNGQYQIVATDIAVFSQAAIDGEVIYKSIEENGIESDLVGMTVAALDLACYYKKGISLEQVKALKQGQ